MDLAYSYNRLPSFKENPTHHGGAYTNLGMLVNYKIALVLFAVIVLAGFVTFLISKFKPSWFE